MTRNTLPEDCYRMATRGGYVLAFATRVAVSIPDLTWSELRNALKNNGYGFCGYAEEAVYNAFMRGRA